jgi:hypothetical protein
MGGNFRDCQVNHENNENYQPHGNPYQYEIGGGDTVRETATITFTPIFSG